MTLIRLGTASPATCPTAVQTLSLASDLAHRAAAKSIDILLLPEAFLGGYPRGTSFGSVIGDRSDAGREEFARYFEHAVDLGDTVGNGGAGAGDRWLKRQLGSDADTVRGDGTREELERIASETGVFIVVGCIERAGGSLYCAVVYVCPREGIVGKRRKVMPTGIERLIWAQGCPSTLRAVTTVIRGVRINLAAAICWESYMPLLRQSLYAQNINLYLAPTADGRDTWLSLMRTIGVEGRCFVVSSNMCIRNEHPDASADTRPALAQETALRLGQRRNSAITEEGFEIALPSSPPSPLQRKKRRKSILDENGNEIVLCCDAEEETKNVQSGRDSQLALNANGHGRLHELTTASLWVSRGGSCIVSPYGDVLAGPQWEDDERLLFADVDFRECIKGRLDLDTAGSYSRNDAFRLDVQSLDLDPLPY